MPECMNVMQCNVADGWMDGWMDCIAYMVCMVCVD